MTAGPGHTVLILGAGLAGLAAAYHLRTRGYAVTVLDHRTWHDTTLLPPLSAPVDLLGCHRESRALLRALERSSAAHTDLDIPLEFQLPDGRIVPYRRVALPAPLHWVAGLFRFGGLSGRDRWTLFSHLEQVWEGARLTPSDLDSRVADDWLISIGQSRQACDEIWAPLAHWLTGNPLTTLSAAQLVHALSSVFLERAAHARLIRLNGTGHDRFLAPLTQTLQQLGTTVALQTDLPRLRFQDTDVTGVETTRDTVLHADWYLSALPHRQLMALLPERLLTRFAYFSQIGELEDVAGVTVQLTCRWQTPAPRLILRSRPPFAQLSVTPTGPDTTHVLLTAIGNPSLQELTDAELSTMSGAELRASLPDISEDAIESTAVVRHDRGALSLRPGAAALRPIQRSPIRNLLVAGAWTDTGWPANIESALVSANRCADLVCGKTA